MARSLMTKRERVAAAVAHQDVDRVPVSFWGHFASDPHRAADIVAETLRFQRRFDWDLIKLMPSGMYYPEALGCTLTPASGSGAVNGLSDSTVKSGSDWARVPVLTLENDWLREHVETVRLTRAAVGPDVPIIQTLFSPLTVAHKMSIHVPFAEAVSVHADSLLAGLAAITAGSITLAQACLDAGADGFFYATQEATPECLSTAEFERFGKQFDLEVLRALRDRATFQLLHVCRQEIRADEVAGYPVDAINWENTPPNPTIGQARSLWKRTLVGGLDRNAALLTGTPAEVDAAARAAIAEAGRVGFILSAGCALPVARPDANLDAARNATV